MILSNKRKTKALISLHGCAGWSAPLLFAHPRTQFFSRHGPFHVPFYNLQVLWEVYSDKVAAGLPQTFDLIFLGDVPPSLVLAPAQRRPETGTDVVYFSGQSGG